MAVFLEFSENFGISQISLFWLAFGLYLYIKKLTLCVPPGASSAFAYN